MSKGEMKTQMNALKNHFIGKRECSIKSKLINYLFFLILGCNLTFV